MMQNALALAVMPLQQTLQEPSCQVAKYTQKYLFAEMLQIT